MPKTISTTLDWHYEPKDFFEEAFETESADWKLKIDAGIAEATIKSPIDPIPEALKESIEQTVKSIFGCRQIYAQQKYSMSAARLHQIRSNGDGTTFIELKVSARIAFASKADLVCVGPNGVVQDTRRERIDAETAFVKLLSPLLGRSPLLQKMVNSYGMAVADPENELVHLYEIRDALVAHFNGDDVARKQLGLSKLRWNRLGELANHAPLKEGRHRGRSLSELRPAKTEELEDARSVARELITAFSRTIG